MLSFILSFLNDVTLCFISRSICNFQIAFFQQALFSYLEPRIDENLSLQPSSDEDAYAYRLATSLVITGIISNVLDRYENCVPTDDQFKLVFRCLGLEQSIVEHAKLLKVLELLTKYFTKNNLK